MWVVFNPNGRYILGVFSSMQKAKNLVKKHYNDMKDKISLECWNGEQDKVFKFIGGKWQDVAKTH